jgi:TRAP-type uncharacterized transport system substrate-binding protein
MTFNNRDWRSAAVVFLVASIVAALSAAVYVYIGRPTHLTIALPSQAQPEARALAVFARALREQKRSVSLRIMRVADVEEAGRRLQSGEVDLALVRTDLVLPSNGLTVAIMSEPTVVLLAPSDDLAGLANKNIGIIAEEQRDAALLARVIEALDIRGAQLVPIPPAAMPDALASGRVSAVALLGPLGSGLSRMVTAAQRASSSPLAVVPIEGAGDIAGDGYRLSEVTIPAATLGSKPRLPGEEATSIATSYRLIAQSDLERGAVSDLTEYLFQMRTRTADTEPAINWMKAPPDETATSAALPNHPGALDYFTREQQTFMDRYGDLLWLGFFAFGGLSSVAAWMVRLYSDRRRERRTRVVARARKVLRDGRVAPDVESVNALMSELDDLILAAVDERQRGVDPANLGAVTLVIQGARAALAEQRAKLERAAERPCRRETAMDCGTSRDEPLR